MKNALFLTLTILLFACDSTKDMSKENNGTPEDMNSPEFVDLPVDPKLYPEPEAGMVKYSINVPTANMESGKKIEIYIGKEMEIDCNKHWLGGKLKKEIIEGWGYNYFVFEAGEVMSTLKGCIDFEPITEFVYFTSELQRYNSRLPLVVYVPEEYEVRYKVWEINDKMIKAQKG